MKFVMCVILILLVSGCVSSYEDCMNTCESVHESIYYDAYDNCSDSKRLYKMSLSEELHCIKFANKEQTKFCYNECK